jgi:uncharacterized membrane protein (DUF4010 family)
MTEFFSGESGLELTRSDFFIRLLVVSGIGFLLGLEREFNARQSGDKQFAGVRTFVFISLLGFIGGLLYYVVAAWLLAIVFLAVLLLVLISYFVTSQKGEVGGTTEIAALLAFLLGLMAFVGYVEESLVITVGVLVILSSKFQLHKAIGSIAPEEMYDFIRFVVLAILVFPFLPDEDYGPFKVINPHDIGLVILLISGIGFTGYMLMKFLGSGRGILITGIIGGLVSSTAVTWVFSRKSKETPALSTHCATAIMSASTVMVLRVIALVFLFNHALFYSLLVPLLVVFIAAVSITVFYYLRTDKSKHPVTELKKESPLQLKSALVFGLIYTLILLMVSYSKDRFGDEGILISSAISGITDIDAITISVSRLVGKSIELHIAQYAILIAAVCNTIVKMGIGIWAGSVELRKKVILGYSIIFISALIAMGIIAATGTI